MYLRILLVSVGLLFISCSGLQTCPDKKALVEGFENFSSDLLLSKEEKSEKELDEIEEQFKIYTDVCYPKYKDELSLEERIEFLKHSFQYVLFRKTEDEKYTFTSSLDLEKELIELSELSGMELKAFIREELKPEMKHVIDDVLSEIEFIGQELKNLLDNI